MMAAPHAKGITIAVPLVWVFIAWAAFLLGFGSGVIWRSGFDAPPPREAFVTPEEERSFKERLHYHGLDSRFSVVHQDRLGRYFIRDGKRVKF